MSRQSGGVQEGVRDDQDGQGQQDSSGSVHVFRGPMHGTVMGSQNVVKNINKTFMPVGSFGKTSEPGKFEVGARIVVLENQPISISSRVFHAKLHSEVTGIKEIVVKITPHDEKHQREAKIHFSVPHHKNIVERILTDVFNFRGQSSIYIAMELCDCNLYDHIKSQVREGISFEPQKYLSIAHQIVVGLDFLHSHNVVHGDLKPSNALLMLDGNLVKLSDFGLSRAISDDKTSTQLTSPQGGTAGWVAPEILEGTTRIAPENDIFPLGLVCNFAWSYGKHPCGDKPHSWNHYISEGTNLNLDRMLIPNADSAKDLLTPMLLRDPANRPTTKQILEHPLFTSQDTNRSNQVSDAQVTEVVDKAFRTMSRAGASEGENEVTALGCTITQLSNAMKRVLDQNRLEVASQRAQYSGAAVGAGAATRPKLTHRRTSRTTSTAVDESSPSDQPSSALQRPQSATRLKELYDEREPGRLGRRISSRVGSSSGRYETSPIGANARQTTYEITILQRGASLWLFGLDVTLYGKNGNSGSRTFELRQGICCQYQLKSLDLGELTKLRLNTESDIRWFMLDQTITVRDMSTNQSWRFPYRTEGWNEEIGRFYQDLSAI